MWDSICVFHFLFEFLYMIGVGDRVSVVLAHILSRAFHYELRFFLCVGSRVVVVVVVVDLPVVSFIYL